MYYELYHHGIKGQRWGVRRFQNKDGSLTPAGKKRVTNTELRKERKDIEEKEYKKLYKQYGINEKEIRALDWGKKHELDLDDGGGGSSKAGNKYMSMWKEINELDMKARVTSGEKARDRLIEKYGEKRVKSLERADKASGIAAASALLAFFGASLYVVAKG